MKKVLMSVLAMGAITMSANAACDSTGCYGVTIDRMYVTSGGTIYVGTSGTESALNCTSPGGVYMSVSHDATGKNAIYSLMLTAQTTKKKINLRAAEGSASCNILFATLDS